MLFKLSTCLSVVLCGAGFSDETSFYFSNDSINGLIISDAYETHEMGVRHSFGDNFVDLNMAIVSPDMHVYRNIYRDADRSYGEIISIEYGDKIGNEIYSLKISSIADFHLSNLQDFAHRVLGLQPVSKINDQVQMPDQFHLGFSVSGTCKYITQSCGYVSYLGTDRAKLSSTFELYHGKFEKSSVYINANFDVVAYDNIVSSTPIGAEVRNIVPGVTFGYEVKLNDGVILEVSDTFRLPTLNSNSSLFGFLSVSLKFRH